MRVSRKAAGESRERIVAIAAKMMRERGVEASSLADVMHAAGMTHGGFYKHFRSKDELTREAARHAFDDVAERFDRRRADGGIAFAVDAYIDEYLSAEHVAHPGAGCPVAALGADAGRNSTFLAAEFGEGIERLIRRVSGADVSPEARSRAIGRLTMLVGAVVAARAVGPGPLRREILAQAAKSTAATGALPMAMLEGAASKAQDLS